MIVSRRWPRATGPRAHRPESSGPRDTMLFVIAPTAARFGRAPSRDLAGDATHSCSTSYIVRAYVTAMLRSASADGARRRRPRRVFNPNHARPQTRRGTDHLLPAGGPASRVSGHGPARRRSCGMPRGIALQRVSTRRRGGRHGRAARRARRGFPRDPRRRGSSPTWTPARSSRAATSTPPTRRPAPSRRCWRWSCSTSCRWTPRSSPTRPTPRWSATAPG